MPRSVRSMPSPTARRLSRVTRRFSIGTFAGAAVRRSPGGRACPDAPPGRRSRRTPRPRSARARRIGRSRQTPRRRRRAARTASGPETPRRPGRPARRPPVRESRTVPRCRSVSSGPVPKRSGEHAAREVRLEPRGERGRQRASVENAPRTDAAETVRSGWSNLARARDLEGELAREIVRGFPDGLQILDRYGVAGEPHLEGSLAVGDRPPAAERAAVQLRRTSSSSKRPGSSVARARDRPEPSVPRPRRPRASRFPLPRPRRAGFRRGERAGHASGDRILEVEIVEQAGRRGSPWPKR